MGQDDRDLPSLTTQMDGWKTGSGTELLLEDGHVDEFLRSVESAKAGLAAQLRGATGLQAWLAGANVGTFISATTTSGHLQEDIAQFIEAINRYNLYLDAVKDTTDAARRSIRNADTPPA